MVPDYFFPPGERVVDTPDGPALLMVRDPMIASHDPRP